MAEAIYRLECATLDLGPEVRSVGLELIELEAEAPVTDGEAARIWAATVHSLAGQEPWALDFFGCLEPVRDFCDQRKIAFREPNTHTLVIAQQDPAVLGALFERFAGETFGVRAGGPAVSGDAGVESALAVHGVDAYRTALDRKSTRLNSSHLA